MENPQTITIEQEMEAIYLLYATLARNLDVETGLGGTLLYVGEPTEVTTRLLRAANIAGAASMAASADAAALRRVMREGALDFVVTSLDEALRILKNEIRKKQPVAVGISVSPDAIAGEMLDRGVQPDLLAPVLSRESEWGVFLDRGARVIPAPTGPLNLRLRILPIPSDWKLPTAAFDAQLLESIAADDHLNRRWVRLAPRYLPAAARRLRSIASLP